MLELLLPCTNVITLYQVNKQCNKAIMKPNLNKHVSDCSYCHLKYIWIPFSKKTSALGMLTLLLSPFWHYISEGIIVAFSWDAGQQINKLFNIWDTHMNLHFERGESIQKFIHEEYVEVPDFLTMPTIMKRSGNLISNSIGKVWTTWIPENTHINKTICDFKKEK